MFLPDLANPPVGDQGNSFVKTLGSASGFLSVEEIINDCQKTISTIISELGFKIKIKEQHKIIEKKESKLQPVWITPQGAGNRLLKKAFVDYQNDVTASDIKLAALEGYESVEHTKRYTTLGMATDQGKLSNVNGLALLSEQLGLNIPKVGTTTFRPPYSPISLGSIAGEASGKLFKATRKTPIDSWAEDNGAHWEPVGDWRRAYAYLRKEESVIDAINREILTTRKNVGLLDASTLGKICVKGPDASKFLDLLYTNMISNMKVGTCKYGLMCNENGFLFDDGVIARLNEETFICHTTSGGSDRVFSWMEEWLQTEWWRLKVYVTNLTEQYAQIGIAGPKSRIVLEKVLNIDLSEKTLPFMGLLESSFEGHKITIFRISFSGELSYEISIPARAGKNFWSECLNFGSSYGIVPYGTEALHVMRAEKGFIMIGDETDGTVIPQDLNLNWAISKKKDDFLGKRAQERSFMVNPNRWKLVGLETIDGSVLPDGAYATADGFNSNGQKSTQGRVTSSYFSPTLKRGIAMGLVVNGPSRDGEVLEFPKIDGTVVRAKITSPVFYDPNGEKQNV
jgi:sarcosine oxidase subunit alpha